MNAMEEAKRQADEFESMLSGIKASLPFAARDEFRAVEQMCLVRSMLACGLKEYPPVTGEPDGERCSGDMVCEKCGQIYYAHPPDWRVIGYGNVPFLNVLCDGRRVKL